jgi:uncharacterized protein (TIGR00369 family)
VPFRSDLTQQHGFLHAGVVMSVLDSACGYAALSLTEEGVGVLTVEFKTNLLAPARGEELIARGRVLRADGRLPCARRSRRWLPTAPRLRCGYHACHDHDRS